MIFVYNFLQIILLILTFPFLLILVCSKKKYRGQILQRIGFGLTKGRGGDHCCNGRRIWIHSLSVGEVTSAVPLVRGIRQEMPDVYIAFSVATATGLKVAEEKVAPHVNLLLSGPLDFLPTVTWFSRFIRPDIFILVETDFWPNWLSCLKRHHIPSMLVNGRISKSSYKKYQRFRFFFAPMFRSFSFLSMQTAEDARQIHKLGIPRDRLHVLGNLKYAAATSGSDGGALLDKSDLNLPDTGTVWICASTHPGEEKILLSVFFELQTEHPNLIMIIAPRDPSRGEEIATLVEKKGFSATLRTAGSAKPAPVLILNTLGELLECYHLARIAFIGGSLTDCGGHNPLEAAVYGVPTFFGPHMEDFQEIARDLMDCGGGKTIATPHEIKELVNTVLLDDRVHEKMSSAALNLVEQNRGVIRHHVDFISDLLKSR